MEKTIWGRILSNPEVITALQKRKKYRSATRTLSEAPIISSVAYRGAFSGSSMRTGSAGPAPVSSLASGFRSLRNTSMGVHDSVPQATTPTGGGDAWPPDLRMNQSNPTVGSSLGIVDSGVLFIDEIVSGQNTQEYPPQTATETMQQQTERAVTDYYFSINGGV